MQADPAPPEAKALQAERARSGPLLGWPFRRWRARRDARRQAEFASLVQHALGELTRAGQYHYDAPSFQLVELLSGTRFPLDSAFESFQRTPEHHRRELLGRLLQTLFVPPLPANFSAARPGLLPSLESAAAHELARRAGPKSRPLAVPIAEGLLASITYRGPRVVACTAETLRQWNVASEQALDVALRNLEQHPDARLLETSAGSFRSIPSDVAGAALLCLPELMRSCVLRGQPVAMVPVRNLLLLTGSDDPDGLTAVAELAQLATRGTRTLCGTAFLLSDQGWIRFESEDSTLRARLRRFEIPLQLRDYSAQKPILEVLERTRGEAPVQVAEAFAAEDKLGQPYTWCIWQEGSPTLLPHTDWIVLARAGETGGGLSVPWLIAAHELGDAMQWTDYYPDRIRVQRFPTVQQLHSLERSAAARGRPH